VTGRGLYVTERVRSVFSVYACFSFLIGRAMRPVTIDRMRPVIEGAYWTPTGAGTVVSDQFLQLIRSLFVGTRSLFDQRVRSIMGPARPIVLRASGPHDERVRSVVRDRRRRVIGASGPCDQRVRSARLQLNLVPNGYIRRGTSINTRWPAQSSISWTF
jgi:hypothetical protein